MVLIYRKITNTFFVVVLAGSKRISDSEVSDYDCDDGIGVVSGIAFQIILLSSVEIFLIYNSLLRIL